MIDSHPAASRFLIIISSKGRPATGKSGLGVWSVYGASLVPRPAARIRAFMMRSFISNLMDRTISCPQSKKTQVFLNGILIEFYFIHFFRAFDPLVVEEINCIRIINFR